MFCWTYRERPLFYRGVWSLENWRIGKISEAYIIKFLLVSSSNRNLMVNLNGCCDFFYIFFFKQNSFKICFFYKEVFSSNLILTKQISIPSGNFTLNFIYFFIYIHIALQLVCFIHFLWFQILKLFGIFCCMLKPYKELANQHLFITKKLNRVRE